MIHQELEFYNKNKGALIEEFNKRFIVINNSTIVGVFKSEKEAFFGMLKSEITGTFLLQYCSSIERFPYSIIFRKTSDGKLLNMAV